LEDPLLEELNCHYSHKKKLILNYIKKQLVNVINLLHNRIHL
jgi:hypothetical protein